ncbi:hypothetical protein HFP15_02760 [Amycolatopsis sp. K13G38]|uniref:Transmembrane protein n=1 Tax=Amycolatopsis acididurans TaxID=2724524 RepID=A0ABX1IWD1_9PSEU|nr:hypothetical protein [Amycolatopsis acididurans]NKQ51798.1 hypothetical protein [Amycolatopsis acididurans]
MNLRAKWLVRQVRWLVSWRNPLATKWDLLDVTAIVVAALLALLAVPAALWGGEQAYQAASAAAVREQAARTPAMAVLLTAAPGTVSTRVSNTRVATEAVWQLPDGSTRTGRIDTDPGTSAGTRVPIWVDRAGVPVPAPMTARDAQGVGLGVGILLWLGCASALAALAWGLRWLVNRGRGADIDREWRDAGQNLNRF